MPILHLNINGTSRTDGLSGSLVIKNNIPKQPIYLKSYQVSFDDNNVDGSGDTGCIYVELSFLNNVDINNNLTPTALPLPMGVISNHQTIAHGVNWGFLPSKDIHKNITYKIVNSAGVPVTNWGADVGNWNINLFFQYNRNLVF